MRVNLSLINFTVCLIAVRAGGGRRASVERVKLYPHCMRHGSYGIVSMLLWQLRARASDFIKYYIANCNLKVNRAIFSSFHRQRPAGLTPAARLSCLPARPPCYRIINYSFGEGKRSDRSLDDAEMAHSEACLKRT